MFFKAKQLVQYEKDFVRQCSHYKNKGIDTEFKFEMRVYFANRMADLDNAAKVVLDCLQTVRAIKNDNQCMHMVLTKHIDKQNPRIEFAIAELVSNL